MNKKDFTKFKVGTVFNNCAVSKIPKAGKRVTINYPSRLEAMALDPGQIVNNNNLVYRAGQIDVCVSLFKRISIVRNHSGEIVITDRTPRHALVRHAAELMRAALKVKDGFSIDVEDTVNLRHCGLGSSSSLIGGVASAINELYSNPIEPLHLVRYVAQNHGEEIDGEDHYLMPVQCIGGSAVCGNFSGGIIILAGEATPIAQYEISNDYRVVIGVPNDFAHPDAVKLMQDEVDNMSGFQQTGDQYGQTIAYRLVHEAMPGLYAGNLKPVGSLIFDYRWNMGSIKNCSFVFPRMLEIAEKLRSFYKEGAADILSLSSVGPGFFAITKHPQKVATMFASLNMRTITTTIHNRKYAVTERL